MTTRTILLIRSRATLYRGAALAALLLPVLLAACGGGSNENPLDTVDGGIDAETAAKCAAAGATVFVAGTAVFGAPDPVAAVKSISTAITR